MDAISKLLSKSRELSERATKRPWDLYYATGESPSIIRYLETKDKKYREYEEWVYPAFIKNDKGVSNTEFIAHAANVHDTLLKIIEEMYEALEQCKPNGFMEYKGEEACKVVLGAIDITVRQALARVESLAEGVGE